MKTTITVDSQNALTSEDIRLLEKAVVDALRVTGQSHVSVKVDTRDVITCEETLTPTYRRVFIPDNYDLAA